MQKRAKKTKESILETAQNLFAANGFHGTTVDSVAKKAGVNKQRIYAYYQNKANLFEACLVAAYDTVNRKEEEQLKLNENAIPEMTRIILEYYMNIHKTTPRFWRLIAWANLEKINYLKGLKNIREKNLSHLQSLYNLGQDKGIFSKHISFETYMYTLFAVTFFYFSNQRTLKLIFSEKLFSNEGMNKLLRETSLLL